MRFFKSIEFQFKIFDQKLKDSFFSSYRKTEKTKFPKVREMAGKFLFPRIKTVSTGSG
jgi:hypothetical protein